MQFMNKYELFLFNYLLVPYVSFFFLKYISVSIFPMRRICWIYYLLDIVPTRETKYCKWSIYLNSLLFPHKIKMLHQEAQ